MKPPAFQFYVADYIRDTRVLSLAARGAWMDCLCQMWVAPVKGQLTLPVSGFARLFGCTNEQAQVVLSEIVDTGVGERVTLGDGKVTLTCRRMYRAGRAYAANAARQARYKAKRARGPGDAGVVAAGDAGSNAASDGEVTDE